MQLGLATVHYKNHKQRKKWAGPWARDAPKYLGFTFNISAAAHCPLRVSGSSCTTFIQNLFEFVVVSCSCAKNNCVKILCVCFPDMMCN